MNQKYTVQKLIQGNSDWKKDDFVFFWVIEKERKSARPVSANGMR